MRPSNNPAVRRWSRWRADLASVATSRHGQALFGNAKKAPLQLPFSDCYIILIERPLVTLLLPLSLPTLVKTSCGKVSQLQVMAT